jgi:hypothetical protein
MALGILYYRFNKIEAAFDSLREAAALGRSDPRPYEWMAVISRKTGGVGDPSYYDREAQKRRNLSK